jgi:hypothetical protein
VDLFACVRLFSDKFRFELKLNYHWVSLLGLINWIYSSEMFREIWGILLG